MRFLDDFHRLLGLGLGLGLRLGPRLGPLLICGLLVGCATSLPSMEGRSTTTALAATGGTRLGMALAADAAAHPGKTGVYPLSNPRDVPCKTLFIPGWVVGKSWVAVSDWPRRDF